MKNTQNQKQIGQLILSLILSIGFVAGIPMIIVFAKTSTIGLITGIVLVVAGFYGSPIAWSVYADGKVTKRVTDAVLEDKLLTNTEIANHLSMSENDVKAHIEKAISNRYLTGYIYDGVQLKTNSKKESNNLEATTKKCSNCGGKLTKTKDGYTCEYCGMKFKDEK